MVERGNAIQLGLQFGRLDLDFPRLPRHGWRIYIYVYLSLDLQSQAASPNLEVACLELLTSVVRL